MTPQGLAMDGLNYLTGKPSDLTPSTKEEVVTSTTLESGQGLIGTSFKYFLEKMENEAVSEFDDETNKGEADASVSYDVVYGFSIDENDAMALIIGMTDTYKSTYKKGEMPKTELLNRVITSVIVESGGGGGIDDIDLGTIKEQLHDYAPIHERVYDGFGTKNWQYVFKWEGLNRFKEEQYENWDNYKTKKSLKSENPSATLPPFARFQNEMKKQLTGYLEERKSIDFIVDYVEQQLDTAHLYGMNEKLK